MQSNLYELVMKNKSEAEIFIEATSFDVVMIISHHFLIQYTLSLLLSVLVVKI